MKLKIVILSFICLLSNVGFAQQLLVDSLQKALKEDQTPLQIINLHLGLARNYSFLEDQVGVKKHATLALDLAKKENWADGQVAALLLLGVWEVNNGGGSEVLFDYIQQALKMAKDNDTKSGLAFANYYLADYYFIDKGNPQKSQEVLLAALAEIDETVPYQHIGNIYKNLGLTYENLGFLDKAISAYNKAIEYFSLLEAQPFIVPELERSSAMNADRGLLNKGQVHVYLGFLYVGQGDFEQAFFHTEQAVTIYQDFQMLDKEAWALSATAYVLREQGDLATAITYNQKALKIFEKVDNKFRMIDEHLTIGEAFLNTKAFDAAKDNFTKAVTYSKAIKDSIFMARAYAYLGNAHTYTGQPDLALAFLHQALLINTKLGYDQERYVVLDRMAKAYEAKKDYPEAIRLHKEAIDLHLRFKNYRYLTNNLSPLIQLYSETNQLDSALHYAEVVNKYVPQYVSAPQQINLAKTLAALYEKTGQLDQSIVQHKNHFQLFSKNFDEHAQQILKNEQVRQNVAGIETQRKQAELESALLASRNQLYIGLATALGFILLLGSYLFYQLRKTKQQLENQNIQLQQLNDTKDKFFGIIAHDIRSPIVALDGVGEQMAYYLQKNRPDKLQRLAGRIDGTAKRLSSLLDNLLNWALLQQGVIPYHPKILNVKEVSENVLAMFKENAALKNIDLTVDVTSSLNVHADESAMNTILRNLVSNAIKFTPQGGKVSLSTETKGDKIFININDTGTGISAEKLTKLFTLEKQSVDGTAGERGTGLGLTIVKELAELNKGTIRVLSELGKGSEFIVGLPIAA